MRRGGFNLRSSLINGLEKPSNLTVEKLRIQMGRRCGCYFNADRKFLLPCTQIRRPRYLLADTSCSGKPRLLLSVILNYKQAGWNQSAGEQIHFCLAFQSPKSHGSVSLLHAHYHLPVATDYRFPSTSHLG